MFKILYPDNCYIIQVKILKIANNKPTVNNKCFYELLLFKLYNKKS